MVLLNDEVSIAMKREEEELKKKCPVGWKPRVFQEQVLPNLPRYVYKPHSSIFPLNQDGQLVEMDKEMLSNERMMG